jgi:hypothetical protein
VVVIAAGWEAEAIHPLTAVEGSAHGVLHFRDARPPDGGRMNECRLVLDTNVFVAAGFEPKSASARLLKALRQGRCRMIWHQTTRREMERVLRRIPPLDWQRFAPLFRPEWEHPVKLDLTRHSGRSRIPTIVNLLRSLPSPKACSSATTIICWRAATSCPSGS